MIVLTDEQRQELNQPEPAAIDPQTKDTYVLLRKETYERLKELAYDDSPWTDEERELLAWEAGQHAGWDEEEMDVYDLDRPNQ